MGISGNGHHRNRRHPRLVRLVLAGIRAFRKIAELVRRSSRIVRGRERRGAELAAADGVAEQLAPPAVWTQRGEIRMTRTARLSSLTGKSGQSVCRRFEADYYETHENDDRANCGD